MREKLLILMKSEQLTASKLAELLGIQPSGISHILGGRNKPSFDLVQKILRRFPKINPDWLLLDKGEMYRVVNIQPTDEMSEQNITAPSEATNDSQKTAERNDGENFVMATGQQSPSTQSVIPTVSSIHGKVKRVIVLFEDHTFESFEMQQ